MSKASEKGARGEREVVAIFDAVGFNEAQRGRAGATLDRGDIAGVYDLTIEVKNHTDVTRAISTGIRELEVEKINNKTRWGVLAVKLKYSGWVAVMPLEEFAAMYSQFKKPGGAKSEVPVVQDGRKGRGARGIIRIQQEAKEARGKAEEGR